MAWINEIKKPNKAQIITIKKTSKGLILYTKEYEAFLWSNSKLAKDLLEALTVWTDGEHTGFELFITPDSAVKLGFRIEMGNDVTILLGDNLWTIDPEELGGDNPFLVKTFLSDQKSPPNPFMREPARKASKKTMQEFDAKQSNSALQESQEAG